MEPPSTGSVFRESAFRERNVRLIIVAFVRTSACVEAYVRCTACTCSAQHLWTGKMQFPDAPEA